MAWCNLSFSGDTGVIEAVAAVNEVRASGNYRTVSLYVAVKSIDYSGARQGTYRVSCSEAGVSRNGPISISGSETAIFNEEFQVYVQPGTSVANINFSFSAGLSSSSHGWKEINGSITQITGLSVVSDTALGRVENIQFGSNCIIEWWALPGMYYKVELSAGSGTHKFYKSSGILFPNTGNTYRYTGINVPIDVANNFPNSVSGTISVTLTQYGDAGGNNRVGAPAYSSFVATLPDNIRPKMNSALISVDNTGNDVVASWGIALAGYSKIKATGSGTGVYSSRIETFIISGEYTADVQGSSLSYIGDIVKTPGNKKLLIKCRDSRGRESDAIETNILSFSQHSPPVITSFVMSKSSSKKFVATAQWTFDDVGGKNSVTSELYYKRTSATDWTPYGAISNNTATELTSIEPDELASYNFRVRVVDKLGLVAQKDAFMSTIQVLLDFKSGGKGLGIGKVCDSDALEVSMDAKFFNEVIIRGKRLEDYMLGDVITKEYIGGKVYPVGSIYMSIDPTSPSSMFGGRWERIKNAFLFGATDSGTYAPGKTGGEEKHTLSVAEMPSHTHALKAPGPSWRLMEGSTNHWPITYSEQDSNRDLIRNEGGGAAHNNMPPFLAVYIWKRIG